MTSIKAYSVRFDEDWGIVVVRVVGNAAHEDHCAAQQEAVRLCLEHKCSYLLVDLRDLSTRLSSTMSCFSFGESLASAPLHLRVAHVLPQDARSAGDVRFTSTVVANRGMPTGEFKSIEEARRWLLGGESRGPVEAEGPVGKHENISE
ncbi:MAG: hypothetical protein MUF59_08910 [Candidatus Krumholzibacteria bacterium]|jgi:hypothetical protein|nr:hypothetical protein [Candidatus Krumholzibacteria bacterium]